MLKIESFRLLPVSETQNGNKIFKQKNDQGCKELGDLDGSYFQEGIEKLEKRWTKCVELRGA